MLTEWERRARLQADPNLTFSATFFQEYLPFLPVWFGTSVPFLTAAAIIGAVIQFYFGRRRANDPRACQSLYIL